MTSPPPPPGKTWAVQTGARIPAAGRPPLGDNVVNAVKSQRRDARIERQRRKVAYRKKQGDPPTAIEQAYNQRAIHLDEWEFARRYSEGFTVRDCNDVPWTAQVVPTYKAAGNSLWQALSYQVNGPGTGPGVDDERLGLRGGRREKAWLYHYFTHVLHNPNHIRHRVYTYLQEADKAHRRRADYDHYSTDWGELSVLRCLATNTVDAGMAKAPIFKTIFQLISDFWDMEVIVYEAPRPLGRWDATYTWYVFGGGNWTANPRFTNPLSGNGQLFFVTDTKWEHFDAVRFDQNLGGIPGFDTEEVEWESRDGKYEIPFLNAGRHNLADIPFTDNGLPDDDAAFARYGRPADDPTFRLPDNHDLVLCFDNDRDAVETRAGYGEGRMPIFPPLDMMNAWGTQDPQPGDSRPTDFEPWLITSGYYREPPGDDNNVLQGRFLNDNARLIDDKQQLFRAQGVVVTQEAEGEILRDPDENVVPFG